MCIRDSSTSKSYDAIGQLVSETDANGNTWTYTYDKDGRQASQTDPLGLSLIHILSICWGRFRFQSADYILQFYP